MCGRYTLTDPDQVLQEAEIQGLDTAGELLSPRYNAAPTQTLPVVRTAADGERELVPMRWGLVPFWAKDASIGNRMINARSETAAEKPSFRKPLQKRRCAVPANGFYEWKKIAGQKRKQPFYIHLLEQEPFLMAGLWERWTKGEEPLETFTILTVSPNDKVAELHDRMPVILEKEAWGPWLDPGVEDSQALTQLLRPYPADAMDFFPVSKMVGDVKIDRSHCIQPVELGAAVQAGPEQQSLF